MAEAFDRIMESLDPPLVIVTTAADGERSGCLVGFHSQASIDPERYCIWLSKANHTYHIALRAQYFAVHFLGQDDLALAKRFGTLTGDDGDKFASLTWTAANDGVPLLVGTPGTLLLRKVALLDDDADHVCVVGEVVEARCDMPFDSLHLSDAQDLEPGHSSDERAPGSGG